MIRTKNIFKFVKVMHRILESLVSQTQRRIKLHQNRDSGLKSNRFKNKICKICIP